MLQLNDKISVALQALWVPLKTLCSFYANVQLCTCSLHLLRVGAAPVDGLQSDGTTRANNGQKQHGTPAPCDCPHHRNQCEPRLTPTRYHKTEQVKVCCLCMSPLTPGARGTGRILEWDPRLLGAAHG